MWTWRGLDLVGVLLCGRPSLSGITFWAVGAGDVAWGAGAPPPPDPGATALTAELARGRLSPSDLSVDSATGDLLVTVDVSAAALPGAAIPAPADPPAAAAQAAAATPVLRELALFGGDASPRLGSGWLISLQRHTPLTVDGELTRTVRLSPPAGLLVGARAVIVALLAGTASAPTDAISWLAVGTGQHAGDPPPAGLGAESARTALGRANVDYVPRSRQLTATATFPFDQAPGAVSEAGLFAGSEASATPGSGTLVAYHTHAGIDRSRPTSLSESFVLALSTDVAVAVPALTNGPLANALTALSTAGLTAGTITQTTDDGHPRGTVLTQSPAAAAPVHPGWQVDLTLSIPTQVVVPPLVGAPASAVPKLLAPAGLIVDDAGSTTREDPSPAGTVLSTTPAAGATVDKGSGVALVTAIAITAVVPDLRGQTPDAASALLAGTGFVLAAPPFRTQESDLTAGTVLSQTPAPNARALLGSTLTPILATGWTVAVPDLSGITPDAAADRLAGAGAAVLARLGRASLPLGLTLGARTARESASPPGQILSQTPAAGARTSLYGVVDVVFATVPTAVVPDVVGSSQLDAAGAITAAGLTVGVVSPRMTRDPTDPKDHTPDGTVLEQQPAAATHWPTGSAVTLTVSTPLSATVPDVTAKSLDVARETLLGRTFTVGTVTPQLEGGSPGSVVTQTPAGGSVEPLGSGISLNVVVGVPSLIGLSDNDARAALDQLGLKLGVVTSQPSSQSVGTVLAQQPAAGAAADPATAVAITEAAPLLVAVPSFAGETIDVAQVTATQAGLLLSVAGTAPSAQAPGTIVSQDPAPQTAVAPGSTITVTTAVALPAQQTVPNLVGLTQDAATALLAPLGLALVVTGQAASDEPALTVVSQAPPAGGLVAPGTVIDVVLAAPSDAGTVLVPDVRAMAQADATTTLTGAGLTVTTLTQESPPPVGVVLSQSPLPGSRVPTGSAVSITVAVAQTAIVPDVVGQMQIQAARIITAAGLVPRVVRLGAAIGLGEVIASRPLAGSAVPLGSVVVITVEGDGGFPGKPGLPTLPRLPRPVLLE